VIVQSSKPPVRALAFVLPQFHPIPENDLWWGKGFTEWTNVAKAKPNFTGHDQPHEPADLGYYDLRVPETKEQQAELAARYGIHGFCYYYYWFAGKRLLYRPLQQILESGKPDFPFCMCWANENWSRAWDGRTGEVLIEQQHSEEDHRAFIHSLFPFFRDKRYITVNGRPLLLIYRIGIIPDVKRAVEIWRHECVQAGIADPYLVAVQSFGLGDPTPYDFDAAVEFPPHGFDFHAWNCNEQYKDKMLNPAFTGHIADMQKVVEAANARAVPDYPLFRGVMPRWDNTARRQNSGLTFVNSTPELYAQWLAQAVRHTCEHQRGDERLLFINAWNEWAEGAHLEPDRRYGHAYLEATRRALFETERVPLPLAPSMEVAQDAAADVAPSANVVRPTNVAPSAAAAVLPPQALKIRVAHWAFEHLPWAFNNAPAYRRWVAHRYVPPPKPGAVELARRFVRTLQAFIVSALRWCYRRLPFSAASNERLMHWMFEHQPWLFRNAPAYRHWLAHREFQLAQAQPAHTQTAQAPPPLPVTPPPPPATNETPESLKDIFFAESAAPQVSVIVPVYGKVAYTLQCLRSIQASKTAVSFEVIVIDDCSKDNTRGLLANVRGLRLVRNDTNLGFLHSCNKAAGLARGAYLLFLNNDTQVHPGWLDALHDTFVDYPQTGLVGSKLVYPNGQLQEAGGIIWSDASGTNYGRDGDPRQPEYCFLRDADYVSGASIMVPRALFEQLGGFDKALAPAYYEDTDLAFAIRKEGYRVVYQPFSIVIHHEGITSGTDVKQGVKAYQVVNQQKMFAKWQDVLASHGTSAGEPWLQRERNVTRRALVCDVTTPRTDRDSGSIDTFQYMRMLQALGYKVVFCPHDLKHDGRYTEALQKLGVECLYQPYVPSLRSHVEKYGEYYDLVLLQRVHFAAEHVGIVRRKCRNARVLFNTVDLHFIREQRQAETEQSAQLAEQAARTKALEFGIMKQCDATIVISETEGELLRKELPEVNIHAIPYVREVQGSASSFQQRRDLVFIGGFLFDPNVDALKYFADEIWPLIRLKLPEVRLLVVGSGVPPEVTRIGRIPGIEIVGFVENITPIFNRCRLSIAPLRYGAGIKGKVGTSISHGVPCVATPIAAEGMGLQDRVDVMIGRDPAGFANAVIEAYQDEVLWDELSVNGLRLFEHSYSFARGLERLKALLDSIPAGPAR
jgi:GT2 family glycosyltransferase/glycosyltransferase involved in cell wall biosynthesis